MILDNVDFNELKKNDQNVNLEQIMEVSVNQMKKMNQVSAVPEQRSMLMEGGLRESDRDIGQETIALSQDGERFQELEGGGGEST